MLDISICCCEDWGGVSLVPPGGQGENCSVANIARSNYWSVCSLNSWFWFTAAKDCLYYFNETHMWSDKLGIEVIFLHKLIFRCWSVGFVCLCKINCVKRCSPHHSLSLSFPWLPAPVSVGDGLAPPSLSRAFLLYEWSRFTSPSQGQGWECVSMCVCVFFAQSVRTLEIHLKCITVAWHDKFKQYPTG